MQWRWFSDGLRPHSGLVFAEEWANVGVHAIRSTLHALKEPQGLSNLDPSTGRGVL